MLVSLLDQGIKDKKAATYTVEFHFEDLERYFRKRFREACTKGAKLFSLLSAVSKDDDNKASQRGLGFKRLRGRAFINEGRGLHYILHMVT